MFVVSIFGFIFILFLFELLVIREVLLLLFESNVSDKFLLNFISFIFIVILPIFIISPIVSLY